ncbi:MAG: hypothetical protein U0610_01670 [bacterium]
MPVVAERGQRARQRALEVAGLAFADPAAREADQAEIEERRGAGLRGGVAGGPTRRVHQRIDGVAQVAQESRGVDPAPAAREALVPRLAARVEHGAEALAQRLRSHAR